jgi:hypothetical protein
VARIEFYYGSSDRRMAVIDDGAVPRLGEFVNIRKITWLVRRVTWAVDNANDVTRATLRAHVELERPKAEDGEPG